MSTYKNLMTVCAVVALALGLAACGGGGSSTTSGGPGTPPPAGPTPTEQIAELQKQINALRAELDLPAIDIDDLTGSVSDLTAQVATLTKQIADRDDAKAVADQKAMTATGKAVYKVLATFGETDGTAEIAPANTDPVRPAVAATYGAATKLTVANQEAFVDGLAGITPADNARFKKTDAGDPASLAANHGFSGTMLTWADTGRADTMTVYTDISMPGSKLFSEVYGDGGQTITSTTTGGLSGAQKGVTGTAFDGRTGGTVTHKPNSKSDTDLAENDVVKLTGRYKGASGSYMCEPTDTASCTSAASATGITFSADNWTFTANTGAMVSVPDGNGHMTFGWWMRDAKASTSPLDNVAVFYNAPHADDFATGGLSGTAKYEGGAAGKYAWQDVDEGTAHGGHFTAKASLTASFGPSADDDTLSGSISDFRIGDDGMDPNWTVTLSEAGIGASTGAVTRLGADAAAGGGDDATTSWAVGANKSSSKGGWEAQLSNSGAKRNDDLPTGVAGAFDGIFGEQGRMVGAFGANITNPNPPK